MAIQRNNFDYASQTLNLDGNIEWWRKSSGRVEITTWIVTGILIAITMIVIGAILLNKVKYIKEIVPTKNSRTGEMYDRVVKKIATPYDGKLFLGGFFMVHPVFFGIGGTIGGAAFMGIAALVRLGVGSLAASRWEAYRESFRHGENAALNREQLRRFIQDAPPQERLGILQRCRTEEELKVYEEVVGRDQTIAIARNLPEYQGIAQLFVGDWKANLKAFDYRTLRDSPIKKVLFFYLVKGMPIGQRFLVAKWLFENGANLFDRDQVKLAIDPKEFQGEENTLLDLGRWEHSSSFLINGCKPELVTKPVATLKDRLQLIFSFSRNEMQMQEINSLLNVLFDEIEPQNNIRNLLVLALGYMEGYFDQALVHMIRDEEFVHYNIQKPRGMR